MEEEFYHKNIFGEVVDESPGEVDEEERLPLDRKGREFNIFTFTDALGARKKKEAWVLYQKALAAGVSAEEIFWKAIWQAKSMILALRTKNVGETEMKPFPYSKAKSFLKNWQPEELVRLSEELVVGYHQARRGRGEIETLLEKLLLRL